MPECPSCLGSLVQMARMRTGAGFLCPERSQKRLTLSFKVGIMVIRSTNPEDCVRELCARAAATDDPDELKKISSQLRAELNEQITNRRDLVVMYQSRAG